MDIAKEKEDLKQRQEAIVKRMNENITQRQQLEAQMQELVREAERLNGEGRMLERFSKDGDKAKPE